MSKEKQIWEQPGYDFDPPYPTSTPVITNYDFLISKTPEELAEWILREPSIMHPLIGHYTFCPPGIGGDCPTRPCKQCWLNWLKSPADKEGTE